jgi:hypothetical protein
MGPGGASRGRREGGRRERDRAEEGGGEEGSEGTGGVGAAEVSAMRSKGLTGCPACAQAGPSTPHRPHTRTPHGGSIEIGGRSSALSIHRSASSIPASTSAYRERITAERAQRFSNGAMHDARADPRPHPSHLLQRRVLLRQHVRPTQPPRLYRRRGHGPHNHCASVQFDTLNPKRFRLRPGESKKST